MEAGYRVLAVDHRGHGRGLRGVEPFRLSDCAEDAAALLRQLDVPPVLAVGYSMGGPIAQLLAYRHPELVRGLVLSATAMSWSDRPRQRRAWRAVGLLGWALRMFPNRVYTRALERAGISNEDIRDWLMAELGRHDPAAMAEAGRELSRYDARPWIGRLVPPTAVLRTTRDRLVSPRVQLELHAAIPGATLFEVDGDHYAVGRHPGYVPALLRALEDVCARSDSANTEIGAAG